ncbi:hypothetical protein WKW79_33750 [Variovorax robiniae]|uniref:Uncharacterized protein n=1 Tax=Variovorax robiniae TaxID=1836199 RepID=A0ABU8XLM4_9BURK
MPPSRTLKSDTVHLLMTLRADLNEPGHRVRASERDGTPLAARPEPASRDTDHAGLAPPHLASEVSSRQVVAT